MLYSAVSQPPGTFWRCIQPGTLSSIMAAQMTWVSPKEASTEPLAWGAMPGSRRTSRSWSEARPEGRAKTWSSCSSREDGFSGSGFILFEGFGVDDLGGIFREGLAEPVPSLGIPVV